ncbi:MAG: hypothetical protein WB660_21550 [Candidatus Sulfotelmatobacter sp.]
MKKWKKALAHVAWSGVFVSGFVGPVLPVAAQQVSAPTQERPVANDGQAKVDDLPDSPGTTLAQTQPPTVPPSSPSQPAGQVAQPPPQKPVGTAAAEAPNTSGVAASEPAGVAIAPAKQRRVRTIVLRTGAIIGAGVAIGTVVALTAGTSSRPPGAH